MTINTNDTAAARMKHQIRRQSQIIERVLNQWGLQTTISGGEVEPNRVLFAFHTPPFPLLGDIDTDTLCLDLEAALGVARVTWVRTDHNGLRLAVPRPERTPVPLVDLLYDTKLALYESCLGLTETGHILYWELDNPQGNHVVATGSPGAGLVDLLHSQAMSLALSHTSDQLRLLLLDGNDTLTAPSRAHEVSPLAPLLDLPHTTKLATGDEAIKLLVQLAYRLLKGNGQAEPTTVPAQRPVQPVALPINRMPLPTAAYPHNHNSSFGSNSSNGHASNGHSVSSDHSASSDHSVSSDHDTANGHSLRNRRDSDHHQAIAPSYPNGHTQAATAPLAHRPNNLPAIRPRLVVLCHRLDRLLARQPSFTALLPQLLNHHTHPEHAGQALPFHLLATVRPPAFARWPVLGGFPLRLVGCVPNPTIAAQETGQPHSQAERLLGGGDFLAINSANGLVHFQAASLDQHDWSYCLGKLR